MIYEFEQGQRYRVLLVLDNFMGRLATASNIESRLGEFGLRGVATKNGPGNFTVEGTWTLPTRQVSHPYMRRVTKL